MIERHVYLRLQPEHRVDPALQEVIERSRALSTLPSVHALQVLSPADDQASAAWDVCLVIRLKSYSDYESFRDDPSHREYVDHFLKLRVQVIKAWNFKE